MRFLCTLEAILGASCEAGNFGQLPKNKVSIFFPFVWRSRLTSLLPFVLVVDYLVINVDVIFVVVFG